MYFIGERMIGWKVILLLIQYVMNREPVTDGCSGTNSVDHNIKKVSVGEGYGVPLVRSINIDDQP